MRGVHHGRHLGRIPFPLTSDRAPRVRTPVRNESPMSTEALKIEEDRVVRFHYTVSEPGQEPLEPAHRKTAVMVTSVAVRVVLGGSHISTKKKIEITLQ